MSQTPHIPSGESSIGHYTFKITIGNGSFGKVKLAEHKLTGHLVAVKILNKKKIYNLKMNSKVNREIKFLKLFNHPHIVRLFEVIDTPAAIYMVMEYVAGGELFSYIMQHGPALSEDEARKFFQQVISGVDYCHRNNVVHRDIKPENLLLDENKNVKLADFGLSNITPDGDFMATSCGSPHYAPPEVVAGRPYTGPAVDVWSCGVLLYAMCVGRLPFDDNNVHMLFVHIRRGQFDLPDTLSTELQDLIRRMLIVDPSRRIGIEEIKRHPWFMKNIPAYIYRSLTRGYGPETDIDESILARVETLYTRNNESGLWSREACIEALRQGDVNPMTVPYYLLLRNRKTLIDEMEKTSKVENEHVFSQVRMNTFVIEDAVDHVPVNEANMSLEDDADDPNALPMTLAPEENGYNSSTATAKEEEELPESNISTLIDIPIPETDTEMNVKNKLKRKEKSKRKKKWSLGLKTNRCIEEVLEQLCNVLVELDCEWEGSPFDFSVRPKRNHSLILKVHIYTLPKPDDSSTQSLQIEGGANLSPATLMIDIQRDRGGVIDTLDLTSQILNKIKL
ncbi:hypothetical protein PCE1_001122 [Barthelona sp. PCE]